MQHASAARAARQMRWVIDAGPDVVVLTEVSAGPGGEAAAHALSVAGYTVHLPPAPDRYRVLLGARSATIDPVEFAGVAAHRGVAATVKLPAGQASVLGLYVPSRGPKTERNIAKRAFQDAVTAALPHWNAARPPETPAVVLGDLNVVEPGHVPHYAVYGGWEYDFYRAFDRNDHLDAFRLRHPGAVEHSWFGRARSDGHRNGYRFDHAFIDRAHRDDVTGCHYDHAPRLTSLSDHSALWLELRV
ncbi:endonuclease/exonuclease/phosphatase family protein [Nocardia sp. NPDC057227]|uniref:endonuclease/exonuclease/phosphatase family protein n=1 Tax=Nocardia sp. NPDC057227 TaxID=3346056 RepID=UPI00362E266D